MPSDFAVDVVSLQALVKGGFVWVQLPSKCPFDVVNFWNLRSEIWAILGWPMVTYCIFRETGRSFPNFVDSSIRWLGNGRVLYSKWSASEDSSWWDILGTSFGCDWLWNIYELEADPANVVYSIDSIFPHDFENNATKYNYKAYQWCLLVYKTNEYYSFQNPMNRL